MLSDNCVVIARFPKGKGFEWRVAHVQAIENCDDYTMNSDGSMEYWPQDVTDASRIMYFGKAPSYSTEEEAGKIAFDGLKQMRDDGDYVEYGVITMNYDRPLQNWTEKEAVKVIDAFWASKGKTEEENGR